MSSAVAPARRGTRKKIANVTTLTTKSIRTAADGIDVCMNRNNGGEQPPDDVSDHSIRPVVAGEVDPRRPPVAFTFLQVSGNYFTPIQA